LFALLRAGDIAWAQETSELEVDKGSCEDNLDPCEVRLGHSVSLHVQNLEKYTGDRSKLILFVNGVPLTGVNALFTGQPNVVRFYVHYERGSESAWKVLLHEPKFPWQQKPIVPVSFGPEGGLPFNTTVSMQLGYFDNAWFWIWLVSPVAILALICGCRSALKVPVAPVFDADASPSTCCTTLVMRYSLSRVQLAFWLLIILPAYFFVCILTWQTSLINTSIILLLGVSGATALGSAVVDAGKAPAASEGESSSSDDQKRKTEIEDAARVRAAAKVKRWVEWKTKHQRLPRGIRGLAALLKDILSDENADIPGVEIHRLQNALWTLALGAVFVRTVWNSLTLQEFDANLVLLMGVSSATFLTMKQVSK
jgi:hypothetical protein